MTWPVVAILAITAIWSMIIMKIKANERIELARAMSPRGHLTDAQVRLCRCGKAFSSDYRYDRVESYVEHLHEMRELGQ